MNEKTYLIKISKPRCLWNIKSFLGEGVLWVPTLNSIFFVDIKKKKILIFNKKTKKKKILIVNKEIGFISHVKKNIFLLGLKSEIRIVDIKKMETIYFLEVESEKPNNRINDGKVDPSGRLWFGTMDNAEKKRTGSLYCLDNHFRLHKVDDGYYITNGPAFLNRNNFYHTDTTKKTIYKIKINNKFKILKKNVFLKFNKKDGSPDGMTTDINNNLWVCHYKAAKISIYNKIGKLLRTINVPAKNVTNCTFGGFKNNEVFISTARKGMDSADLRKYPLSGSLFISKTNSKGKKSVSFKMSNMLF